MAYIVGQDIVDRIGTTECARITSPTGSSVDYSIVNAVAAQACGEANGYLATRYATPVIIVGDPELAEALKAHVLAIGIYRLFLRRPPVPEDYKDAYQFALDWLKGVAAGKIDLPASATPAPSTSAEPYGIAGSLEQVASSASVGFLAAR